MTRIDKRADWDQWEAAIKTELDALDEQGTWETVSSIPPGVRSLGTKLVLKVKYLEDGEIDKYKARLVVQGFRQVDGVDYSADAIYAPTTGFTTVLMLLSIAAAFGHLLYHIDFSAAFVQAKLSDSDVIYLRLPQCYGGRLVRLRKTLYGTKQAARSWHDLLAVTKSLCFGFWLKDGERG